MLDLSFVSTRPTCLVHINDADSVCCAISALQIFADDARLYCEVAIENGSLTSQQSVDKLDNWAYEWQL